MSAYLPPRITPPGAEKPRFDSQVLVADVTLARTSVERPTVFARVGWRYPWLCTIASLAGALACAVGAWRRRASEAQPDAVSST